MSTFDRLAHIFTEYLGIVSSCVTPGTRISELGLDSLDWVDVGIEIETEFGFDIDENCEEQFENVGTLAELADALDAIKSKRAA